MIDFEETYLPNNTILFVVTAPKDIAGNPEVVEALKWLTQRAWMMRDTLRVDSIANYPHLTERYDEIEVSNLLDAACPRESCSRTHLLRKPHILGRFTSTDLQSFGTLLTLDVDIKDAGAVGSIETDAKTIIQEFQGLYPSFRIVHTGGVPMMQAFVVASTSDSVTLLPIAMGTIAVLLLITLGSIRMVFLLLAIGGLATAVTMSLAGWFGHVVNSATSIAPLLILTLVITSSMHLLLRYIASPHDTIDEARFSAQRALQTTWVPMVLTSATSVAGLMSMTFADAPPIRQLGVLTSIGVVFGLALTLLSGPILIARIRGIQDGRFSRALLAGLSRFANEYLFRTRTTVVLVLIVLGASIGITNISINGDFIQYFDARSDFRIETEEAMERLAGPYHIELRVGTGRADGVFEPSYIGSLLALVQYVRSLEGVRNAFSLADVLMDINEVMNPGRPIGSLTFDELSQYFLIYELSLGLGQSVTDLVDIDRSESRVSVLLDQSSSRDVAGLEKSIETWHTLNHLSEGPSLNITGENIPVAHLSYMNIRSMLLGIVSSLVGISLLIGLVYRKTWIGLVMFAATVVPALVGFGLWGWTVSEIGLAATVVIAITIGVVIDDAIHMIHRFEGDVSTFEMNPRSAGIDTVSTVGHAVVSSTTVLLGGLICLVFSGFKVNSAFGACTCLVLLGAVVFDLGILPRLLVWSCSGRSKAVTRGT